MQQKISRSKIDLFTECPRCFWLDLKERIKRPDFPPYTINNAVDYLLKQQFDTYREAGKPHPIMEKHGLQAVPFRHPDLEKWRHNFTGVQYDDPETGFFVFGAVDDVWVTPEKHLLVVDYKATGANQYRIYDSYARQMEIYQWLLRRNGFTVSPTGYFVFAKVNKGQGFENQTLPFDLFLESYTGDDGWVSQALSRARETLEFEEAPEAGAECKYCNYVKSVSGKQAGRAARDVSEKKPRPKNALF